MDAGDDEGLCGPAAFLTHRSRKSLADGHGPVEAGRNRSPGASESLCDFQPIAACVPADQRPTGRGGLLADEFTVQFETESSVCACNSDGGGCPCAADRLCPCCQPAARARFLAASGERGPP